MTAKEARHRYYQGAADLHMISGALTKLNGKIAKDFDTYISVDDRKDFAAITRAIERVISRAPERYRHVIERCDGAIARQFGG